MKKPKQLIFPDPQWLKPSSLLALGGGAEQFAEKAFPLSGLTSAAVSLL